MPALVGGFGNRNNKSFSFNNNTPPASLMSKAGSAPPLSKSVTMLGTAKQQDNFPLIFLSHGPGRLNYCTGSNFKPAASTVFPRCSAKSQESGEELNKISNLSATQVSCINPKQIKSLLGPYLAGLIEGDGTFAVHDKNSTALKYRPMIIVVFKKADLPLAKYLQILTNSGSVYIKSDRGYVLWQIQDITGVYTIVNLINGYMRSPKIEALNRTIHWLNDYIDRNQNSKLPSTQSILLKINKLEITDIDNSPLSSNPWLAGFSDADSNFSINIHKRSNKNLTRVQLFYRLELRQTYHRLNNEGEQMSYFSILSKVATYLGSSVLSRSRILKGEKQFHSFIVMAASKGSLIKVNDYFNEFPLLSSKYLDYISWCHVLDLQRANSLTTSYLAEALTTRKDFNKTRTTYKWDHLENCYLTRQQS